MQGFRAGQSGLRRGGRGLVVGVRRGLATLGDTFHARRVCQERRINRVDAVLCAILRTPSTRRAAGEGSPARIFHKNETGSTLSSFRLKLCELIELYFPSAGPGGCGTDGGGILYAEAASHGGQISFGEFAGWADRGCLGEGCGAARRWGLGKVV